MADIDEKRIRKLVKVLANYSSILIEFGIKDQIIKTFKFEKPLTSIEIVSEENDKIKQFMKEMEEFFFIGNTDYETDSQFSSLVFVSRFKNLLDVAISYTSMHNSVLDKFADLSGILTGYSPKEVAEYCSEERLKKYNLIK